MTRQFLVTVCLAGMALACSSEDGISPAPGAGSGGSGGSGSPAGSTGGTGGARPGTGGAGGGTAGTGGGAPAQRDAGAARDTGAARDAARAADSAAAAPEAGNAGVGGPAAALHNQVTTVSCPMPTMGGSCQVAANLRAYEKPFTIVGDPATTYRVAIKICAVYEGHPYSGCMTSPDSPRICINGTPVQMGFSPTYPTLALRVAEPARTYFLNSGNDWPDDILKLDYTATFEMRGGTTVTLLSDGGNNGGIFTPFQMNRRHTCPNVPGIATQPYSGQFIHMQVVSTDPMN